VGGAPEERRRRALATVVRAAFGAVAGSAGGTGGGAAVATATSPLNTGTQSSGGSSPQASAGVTAVAQPSTGGFIQADPATNSLVITAPEPLYKQVRALIDQLDTRRAQVYIESMIVEVAPTDAADFGFQWQGLLGQTDNSGLIAGTNFSGSGRPSIIDTNVSAAGGEVNLGAGLNIGLLRRINGITSLAAIARAAADAERDQYRLHART
jgi:general secretion pathway protein D